MVIRDGRTVKVYTVICQDQKASAMSVPKLLEMLTVHESQSMEETDLQPKQKAKS